MKVVIKETLTYNLVCDKGVAESRLLRAAFELAMSDCKLTNPQGGINLGDNMFRLLDLRFADDVLIFATPKEVAQNLLDSLMRCRSRRIDAEHSKECGVNNGSATTFLHSSWGWPHAQGTWSYRIAQMAWLHALVGTPMWNTVYSKQPRLSRNTVGCYNAKSFLTNIDCAISNRLILQQFALLPKIALYIGNI